MRNILLLSALCVGTAATSYADTTFNLVNNVFASGATAQGSVNIDTTTGLFDSVNVSVLSAGTTYSFTGAPSTQSVFDNNTQYFEESFDTPGDELVIDVPVASLVGYQGGSLCSLANLCGDGYAGAFAIRTGATTATADPLATGSLSAATPEPSSLVLLGTAACAMTGAVRRRLARTRSEIAAAA